MALQHNFLPENLLERAARGLTRKYPSSSAAPHPDPVAISLLKPCVSKRRTGPGGWPGFFSTSIGNTQAALYRHWQKSREFIENHSGKPTDFGAAIV